MAHSNSFGVCERVHKLTAAVVALLALALVLAGPAIAYAQHEGAAPGGHEQAGAGATPHEGTAAAHGGDEAHEEGPLAVVWRISNFALLVGLLWYFLKAPLATYLNNRSEQIRTELVQAERTRTEASARLAALEARVKALPQELAALRQRGTEEIAAEEARIREQAAAERERLLEQTRREIDARLRAARRELAEYAAELSVNVARDRLASTMTPEDHVRLMDRYVSTVGKLHE